MVRCCQVGMAPQGARAQGSGTSSVVQILPQPRTKGESSILELGRDAWYIASCPALLHSLLLPHCRFSSSKPTPLFQKLPCKGTVLLQTSTAGASLQREGQCLEKEGPVLPTHPYQAAGTMTCFSFSPCMS